MRPLEVGNIARRLTSPRTCSRSSKATSSTLPAPYGDPNAGDPIRDDVLRIEHDQGAVGGNQHGRRNEAVASRPAFRVEAHADGRPAPVRQEASLVRIDHREG